MSNLSLFDAIKTTDQLTAGIETQAARKCNWFHWSVGTSKLKTGQRIAVVNFVGEAGSKRLYLSEQADSLDHALFLLHKYLHTIK